MRWYSHLYVGEQAAKKRYAVIQKIRNGTGGQNIYVITPASNGNNLLDIYSVGDFSHPYYQQQDMLILGIAAGYQEALVVAGKIVNDMYQATGEFSLERFLKQTDDQRLE